MRPHVILLQQNQSLMMGAKEHVEQKALKSLVLIVICNIQMRIMVHIEANSRLKQIEKEYTQKLAKSSQIIAELQTTISSLKEESSRQQLAADRRLQDVIQKFEDEKKQLIRDNDRAIKVLQDELESRSNQVRCAEKKLQHKELESQEQITYIRQEYETKFKGLMPASLRQELEDTISSLKSQVNFLQKRASVLQEELTTYQGRRYSP
ncbi:Coiled-coil domain-containing protein 46 [Pteropus alecto]|uniref:Coiled-coil domain-containing protein 46 n=1 Tax=Pteropus alecto TaxID=9402 RepID=L5KP87_PTEAL|nr:Coiled-coil domain-containing protein 46 [Pteropus alecto]